MMVVLQFLSISLNMGIDLYCILSHHFRCRFQLHPFLSPAQRRSGSGQICPSSKGQALLDLPFTGSFDLVFQLQVMAVRVSYEFEVLLSKSHVQSGELNKNKVSGSLCKWVSLE